MMRLFEQAGGRMHTDRTLWFIQTGIILFCTGVILYYIQRIFDRLGERQDHHCSCCHTREEAKDTQQDNIVDDKKPASTAYRTAPDRVIEKPQPKKDPYPLMKKFLQETMRNQAQHLTFRASSINRGDMYTERCNGCEANLRDFNDFPCFSLTGGSQTLKTGYYGIFCAECGTCITAGPNNPDNKNAHDLIREEAIRQQVIPPPGE